LVEGIAGTVQVQRGDPGGDSRHVGDFGPGDEGLVVGLGEEVVDRGDVVAELPRSVFLLGGVGR
jgi:hypothetical protein